MIEINNLTSQVVDQGLLKKIVREVLKKEGKEKEGLSIVLVGQARIRKLNKKYLGKNRVTDVLAFPQGQMDQDKFVAPPTKACELGEIVICLREVKKNSQRFNSVFEKELTFCLIHGVLHLLGYEHEKNEKKTKKMEEREKYYLSQVLKSVS